VVAQRSDGQIGFACTASADVEQIRNGDSLSAFLRDLKRIDGDRLEQNARLQQLDVDSRTPSAAAVRDVESQLTGRARDV